MLALKDKKDQVNGQTPIWAIGELSFAVLVEKMHNDE
jgi:hypothetical protein